MSLRLLRSGLVAALPVLAAWSMLSRQGARFGTYQLPALSVVWVLLGAIAALWLARNDKGATTPTSRRSWIVAACLGASLVALSLWRHERLSPPLDLQVTLSDGRRLPAETLQLPERRDLRRLTGERRNVAFETRALLESPAAGTYRLDVFCDDYCEVDIGRHHLVARGALSESLELQAGALPFRLSYRQGTGPAALLFAWDRPSLVELLPIEYYLSGNANAEGPRGRWGAHTALALLVLWWVVFATALSEVAPIARSRLVPVFAAALLGLYGSALRVEAFLAHSRLAETSPTAARWHERLLPFTPPYAIFNPENAPDDPYRADVRSYLDRAEAMSSPGAFYAPSFREPLYVALTKPFLSASGGEIGILAQSLVFSILTLPLLYAVAYRSHGPWWALALLVPVALHEWLVLEAPTGYRMSAYGFFLLAFVAVVSLSRSAAAAGVLGGALCLIRLSALSVVLPVLATKLLELSTKPRRRYVVVSLALVVGLLGPFLWSNYRAHGDPFYSVSFHTEFWLRAEGLDREAEGPVGWMRYFTDFGRGREVVKGTALGMTLLPLRTFYRGLARFPGLGLVTLVLGLVGLFVPGSRFRLLVAYLGQLLPFAYIQNFPSGEMPRFVMPAFLLLVLAVPPGARALTRASSRLREAARVRLL